MSIGFFKKIKKIFESGFPLLLKEKNSLIAKYAPICLTFSLRDGKLNEKVCRAH